LKHITYITSYYEICTQFSYLKINEEEEEEGDDEKKKKRIEPFS
jgi:hypothetical protein